MDSLASLIVHTVDEMHQQLTRCSPFFRVVVIDGSALHDAGIVTAALDARHRDHLRHARKLARAAGQRAYFALGRTPRA